MTSNATALQTWQQQSIALLRKASFNKPTPDYGSALTLLAYHFWDDNRIETEFWRIEFSFLCAFRALGVVKSVLVTNDSTTTIQKFCAKYDIEIQVEPSLSNGGIRAMCADCCGKLHSRFSTDYVLIIQNDGIIVNPGVEKFIGKYDYVGAPWPGHISYYDWFPYPRFGVGNGGLSLRSKRLCEAVSKHWNHGLKLLPYNFLTIEDNFYCKTLSLLPGWRKHFKYPSVKEAASFSIDTLRDFHPEQPPIGFHSPAGFSNYCEFYGTPLSELIA